MNFPEIPQWEELDFLSCLRIFDTSIGDVFIEVILLWIESNGSNKGTKKTGTGNDVSKVLGASLAKRTF